MAGFGDVGIFPHTQKKKLMTADLGGQDSNSGPPLYESGVPPTGMGGLERK